MGKGTITVTYGEEQFFPVKYSNFIIGPFTYTTDIREGETKTQAFTRANDFLTRMADVAFTKKRDKFMERLKEIQ